MQSGVRFCEDMILMEDFLFVLELLPYCQNIYSLPEAIYRYRQAEDEKGAYRRLQRISDLAGYMQPLEAGLGTLGISPQEAENLYEMLLRQNSIMRRCVKFAGFLRSKNKVNTLFRDGRPVGNLSSQSKKRNYGTGLPSLSKVAACIKNIKHEVRLAQ